MSVLRDTFGRLHESLRISITDRCNIRCMYCMPERGVEFLPQPQVLTFEEIERFARIAVGLGITKIRITGGEPLLRKDLPELVGMLAGIPGVQDLALTTNGVVLERLAEPLRAAGLHRINIHLDTLHRDRFIQITRRDWLDRVLGGIMAAKSHGFDPIKINSVVVRDLNDCDIVPLARFGREHGLVIRFIEFMPLDSQGLWDRGKVLLADEILERLSREVAPLIEIPDRDPRAPATEYRYADGGGTIGFVASVSRPFCGNCNRIRLTAEGKLRYCLFATEEADVRALLRGGAPDEQIAELVRRTVHGKWEGHEINTSRFVAPARPMYAIGG